MEFLRFLQTIANPVLDFLFYVITFLGDETCFMVIAIAIFWCVNKRGGYYVLTTGLIGTVINQWLKLIFRIPRPWVLDPTFEVAEELRETAPGYSFPSGHTQNISGTFGSIFAFFRVNWLRITSIVLIVLVAFSRMYLGVHTPLDVSVSLGVALILVLVLYPIFSSEERFNKYMPWVVGISAALTLAFLIYVNVIPAAEYDSHNLESGMKNGATLFGCMLALLVVYPLDRLVIKFETRANWYSQILKLVGGLGGVLLIKELTRSPLEALVGLFTPSPIYIARGIRYFLVVVFAGAVWPLTFKYFSEMKIPFMEKFTEWLHAKFAKKQHAPTSDEE